MSEPTPAENQDKLLRQFADVPDESGRHEFLSRNPALLRPEIVTALADQAREKIRVDVQQALRLADAALAIAGHIDNKESLARGLRAKANVLYALGKHTAAVDLHQQAAVWFEAVGQSHELARTLSGSIQPMLLLGEYNRAFAAAERARQIFSAEGNAWRLARLEINIGNIHYRQDRFVEAQACYESAYRGLLNEKDAEGIAAVLSNLATCYISLNAFPKAIEAYRQARQFCQEHGMPLLVSQADYNIAYLHYQRGEYSKAIEMLRAARQACTKVDDTYHLALCNLDLAELYLELNLSADAAELARQGYEGFQKLGMGYESAKCLAFSAIAASQQGHGFEGLKLFSEARQIFVREKNQAWPSLIDLYRALVFYNEGRLFEARRLAAEALESFRTLNLGHKLVLAQLLLARIGLRTEDLEQAYHHGHEAIGNLAKLEAPVLAYQAHLLMGNIHSTGGRVDQAYSSYQSARQALETLRSSLRGEELKVAFIKNRLEVYERLVELCLHRSGDPGATEEAFGYVEQAKSRSLMDLFLRPAPTVAEDHLGQSELVRSMRDLREELNWYYNLIEREQLQPEQPSPERIATLQKQAGTRERELLHMLHEATPADAEQAGLQTPTNLPIAAIRSALPPDTLLIEYFRVKDRILMCLLGQETLEIFPVTLETRVAGFLRLLQFQLSKVRLNAQYLETFKDSLVQSTQAHLTELYQELIAPVSSRLQASHLVFVPHGLLHYVPFHALFDGTQHLIDRYTVSYSPSASIFALSQSRTANSSGAALVFGIPDPQAPAILDEVQALTGVLERAELFVGQNATEHVLRNRGPKSRMIHIATHGHFRQDNPMFSAIRMGESFLSLFDLYQLRLPVELITLSGCSTGLNVVSAGDELIGLARGLMHAAFNTAGANVIVAVIDTGVDPTHPVLMNSLVTGYDFTRGKSGGSEDADVSQSTVAVLDHRQPAKVSQSTVAVLDQSSVAVLDGPQYAAFGHGTMVSGIVHLVAPRAKIMPLKSFHSDGTGYNSDILSAIYYAVNHGAKVINMSFNYSTSSQELANAVNYANSMGVICVAAAGNDGQQARVYPGALKNVIDVASTGDNDIRSTFSNYGAPPVWLAAPGEGIMTTYPFGTWAAGWGTSFSAPLVSGTAALLVSTGPTTLSLTSVLTGGGAKTQAGSALSHTQPISDSQMGYGRLDTYQAMQAWRKGMGLK